MINLSMSEIYLVNICTLTQNSIIARILIGMPVFRPAMVNVTTHLESVIILQPMFWNSICVKSTPMMLPM